MHFITTTLLALLTVCALQAATVTDLANPETTSTNLAAGENVNVGKNGGTEITSGGATVLLGSGSAATLGDEEPMTLEAVDGYAVVEGSTDAPVTINLPGGAITITGSAALLYDAKTGNITLTVFSGDAIVATNGNTTTLSGPYAGTGNSLGALSQNLVNQPLSPRADARLTALLNEVDRLAALGQRTAIAANASALRAQLVRNTVAENNYMPEAFRNRMVDPSLIISND